MRIAYPSRKHKRSPDAKVSALLAQVSKEALREAVETLSRPRHYVAEAVSNQRCARWIGGELESHGYETQFQGPYGNIVATLPNSAKDSMIFVGAHYDSVPGTPGADDNASGVAALLECARLVAGLERPPAIGFVAFNREED